MITHGGNLFFRGSVFAENGYFRGELIQGGGVTHLKKDGSGQLANGLISWNKFGEMFRKGHDNIQWVSMKDFYEDKVIDLTKGTYLDLTYHLSDDTFLLPASEFDATVLSLRWEQISRSSDCATLEGSFKIRIKSGLSVTYETASKLRLEVENKEIELVYSKNDDAWIYRGEGATISNGLATISKVVTTDTETITDKVTSNTYVAGDKEGITQAFFIQTTRGTHRLTFTSGLLTSYEFESANE